MACAGAQAFPLPVTHSFPLHLLLSLGKEPLPCPLHVVTGVR